MIKTYIVLYSAVDLHEARGKNANLFRRRIHIAHSHCIFGPVTINSYTTYMIFWGSLNE